METLLFGDGRIASILQKKLKRNDKGLLEWQFLIRPSEETVDDYGLRDELNPEYGAILRSYKKQYVWDFKYFIFVTLDLDSNSTEQSRKDEGFINTIQNQQKTINTLTLSQAKISETIHELANLPHKKLKDDVELFKFALEVRKRGGEQDELEEQSNVE